MTTSDFLIRSESKSVLPVTSKRTGSTGYLAANASASSFRAEALGRTLSCLISIPSNPAFFELTHCHIDIAPVSRQILNQWGRHVAGSQDQGPLGMKADRPCPSFLPTPVAFSKLVNVLETGRQSPVTSNYCLQERDRDSY